MKKIILLTTLLVVFTLAISFSQTPPASSPQGGKFINKALEAKEKLEKVNINTATEEQLELKLHIDKECAKAIVEYRAKNGPFKSVEDIKNVQCVVDKYEQIKNKVIVKLEKSEIPSPTTTTPPAQAPTEEDTE